MGLDMWLVKIANGEDVKKADGTTLIQWRKANQIRDYFAKTLDNFQDNGRTEVTKWDIENLIEVCEEVLDDNDKASELLPTSNGFLFGSEHYGEWYFDVIEDTVNKLKKILKTVDFNKYKIFYDEWY